MGFELVYACVQEGQSDLNPMAAVYALQKLVCLKAQYSILSGLHVQSLGMMLACTVLLTKVMPPVPT